MSPSLSAEMKHTDVFDEHDIMLMKEIDEKVEKVLRSLLSWLQI